MLPYDVGGTKWDKYLEVTTALQQYSNTDFIFICHSAGCAVSILAAQDIETSDSNHVLYIIMLDPANDYSFQSNPNDIRYTQDWVETAEDNGLPIFVGNSRDDTVDQNMDVDIFHEIVTEYREYPETISDDGLSYFTHTNFAVVINIFNVVLTFIEDHVE